MLRKLRIVFALIFFVGITLLFLDVSGVLHLYLGWMEKCQLLPAILSLSVVGFLLTIVVTLLFGRIYCSVICPLGVLQDCFSWLGGKVKRHRFHYAKPRNWLRYVALAIFVLLMVLGINGLALLFAPYSMFGRIAATLLQPVYVFFNNLLAMGAEHLNSYAFYTVETFEKGLLAIVVAVLSLLLIGFLSFRYGRLWCNTICPVGSFLGLISRFSLFAPVINTDKCNGCTLCARNCKSMCINPENHTIDYSRCVACMDCISNCRQGAIRFQFRHFSRKKDVVSDGPVDASRRKFLSVSALFAALGVRYRLRAAETPVDGGLAVIEQKKIPSRSVPLKPFGALSLKHFSSHCTSCMLCMSECPSHILSPSKHLDSLLQPEINYVEGFCRPECTRCSQVCPTGAIKVITPEEKSAISIGHAVVILDNCLSNRDGISCGSCARHCPAGAIRMVPNVAGVKIPSVDESRCIGCGACEFYCPSRPLSAIYVEGRQVHTSV